MGKEWNEWMRKVAFSFHFHHKINSFFLNKYNLMPCIVILFSTIPNQPFSCRFLVTVTCVTIVHTHTPKEARFKIIESKSSLFLLLFPLFTSFYFIYLITYFLIIPFTHFTNCLQYFTNLEGRKLIQLCFKFMLRRGGNLDE